MNRELPQRRRARAIAIGGSAAHANASRAVLIALAGVAALAEAALLVHRLWAAHA